MAKLRIVMDIEESVVLTKGVEGALRLMRLEASGKVIIPVDLGRGLTMHNPAPCGTWERVED